MPRKQRKEIPGLPHHATLHGVDTEFIFRSEEDRIAFVLMLAATSKRFGWNVLAYCLMGTHLHLLVETTEPNFGAGMQWLSGQYARCFNKHYGRKGHLFKDRYHDEPVESDSHLNNVVGYIAGNPVEAGLCADPREWRWSSHAAVSEGRIPDWLAHERLVDLLGGFGPGAYERIIAARTRYRGV